MLPVEKGLTCLRDDMYLAPSRGYSFVENRLQKRICWLSGKRELFSLLYLAEPQLATITVALQ